MNFDIDKIKAFPAILFIGVIGGVILPGFLFLFVYNKTFFYYSDYFLLCVIAIGITLPLFFLNFFLIMTFNVDDVWQYDLNRLSSGITMLACGICCVSFLISIVIGYYFEIQMGLGVGIVIGLEIVLVFTLILSGVKKPK
jgi:hypothetical protein